MKTPRTRPCTRRRVWRSRGFTLIEMMVALVVAMMLSAAVFAVLKVAETKKRTLTSANDIDQAGNYAMYLIERWVRSAGHGFVQSASYAYGCPIYASLSNGQILPRVDAIPAPFDTVVSGVSATFRLAPVVILPGQSTPGVSGSPSDVLVVMASGSGTDGAPVNFSDYAASGTLNLQNTLGFNGGDLTLIADKQGAANCMVEQVASSFTAGSSNAMSMSGSYYSDTIGSTSITALKDTSVAMDLGNPTNNPPQFLLVGVGDNNVLFSYDLLKVADTPLQYRAEGVFEMHALYGVDANGDHKISSDEWFSPSSTDYKPATLLSGSAAANATLQNIKAIRVGLIMRTSLPEKAGSPQDPVSTSITLFDDSALSYERKFVGAEQQYRYRKIELTIPLRNNLMLQ